MQFSKKLLFAKYLFPVKYPVVQIGGLSEIVSITTNTYTSGTIEEDGWYLVQARAGNGQTAAATGGGAGGRAEALVYLYAGTKYLIWGASGRWTGYPHPSGNGGSMNGVGAGIPGGNPNWGQSGILGGGGCTGGVGDSGGGGGGAAGNGGQHTPSNWSGWGGGGSGFIAGIDTYGSRIITNPESWNHDGLSFDTLECMVLAGGGGGGGGHIAQSAWNGGGAGGGAWGNGGNYTPNPSALSGGSGPGGSSGQGGGCGIDTPGGQGGWAIRDWTRGKFQYGTGSNLSSYHFSYTGLWKVL